MSGPGWIVTPGTILDYMREVDRFIDAIHQSAWSQFHKVPVPVLTAWMRFFHDWKTFFAAHEGFLDRLSGAVADTTERYETDAAAWKKTLAQYVDTGAVVFDETKRPGGPQLPTADETTSVLKWAAVLGGLYLAGRYFLPSRRTP